MKKLVDCTNKILAFFPGSSVDDSTFDGDLSYFDDVVINDDHEREEWSTNVMVPDLTPAQVKAGLEELFGESSQNHPNGAANWTVDNVLIVAGVGNNIELFLDYDKVSR